MAAIVACSSIEIGRDTKLLCFFPPAYRLLRKEEKMVVLRKCLESFVLKILR